MFGTLHIPSAEREVLEFGVEPDRPHAHTIRGELLAPFGRAGLVIKELLERRLRPVPLGAPERKRA